MVADDGRGRGSWRGKLLLLALSLVVSLIVVEWYLRKTTPYLIREDTPAITDGAEITGNYGYFLDSFKGRRLIPGTHAIFVEDGKRSNLDINAHGFRGEEIPATKGPADTRIIVLGDSITFARGIPVEKTFCGIAEATLRAGRRFGRIDVVNGGVEGIGTKDEVDILESQGLAIAPDVVVVAFYLNDGNLPDRFAAGLANPGFVRRHSILAQTVYRAHKIRQYMRGTMEEANYLGWLDIPPPADWMVNRDSFRQFAKTAARDWGAAWEPKTWEGIEEQLRRLEALALEHRFRVAVVAFPVAFQVEASFVEDEPQRRLAALCSRHRFDYLDLLPAFRAFGKGGNLLGDICHLTEEGHLVVGAQLAAFLQERVLSRP